MVVTCRKCKAKIFSHTALCDHRNDPNKEFGCPNCGFFYLLPFPYRNRWNSRLTFLTGLCTGFALFHFLELELSTISVNMLLGLMVASGIYIHHIGLCKLQITPYRSSRFDYGKGDSA